VFGLAGEVRVYLYNPATDLFDAGLDVDLRSADGNRRMAFLELRSGAGRRILGRMSDVRSREAAAALKGTEIWLPRQELPKLDEQTFYHHDLIGLPVQTKSGKTLGRLREIHASGQIDCWVVHDGQTECYLPALQEVVLSVDPNVGITVADDSYDII
jgi:16S rRNA processing protein RimM